LNSSPDIVEIIVAEINLKGHPNLIVASAYRPPNTNITQFSEYFDAILDKIILKIKFLFWVAISI